MLIIDCHCHAGKGDGLTGPWDTDASLGRYLKRATAAGIGRTTLFAAFHSDYAQANRAVAQIVRQQPERFDGFAFVNAQGDRGRVRALVHEAVTQFGFCGIKVHRYDARITREICGVAQLYRLPVLYDVMGEVSSVHLLATEYPRVNFIVPHLGSFADDWKAQQAFLDPLSRYPNIFTDTSGVRRFDLLVEAVRRAGPTKILFGSDGPWLHPGVELAKVHALGLAESALADVVARNYLRLTAAARRRAPRPAQPPVARADSDPWSPQGAAEALGSRPRSDPVTASR
jgi:predicted TIM-barrel fold metal-dependent hydrolase